jgi:hypothetical protein
MAEATLKDVAAFFEMPVGAFRDEWVKGGLTEQDKNEIKEGIGNGTLTY